VRRFWWLVLAGCQFTPGSVPTTGPCETPATVRFPIDAGGAPPGFTITVDVTDALALGTELRVFDDADGERDRIIEGSLLDVRMPASGGLHLEAGDGASPPLADPANVYLFAEAFDSVPIGDKLVTRFDARPATDWSVIADATAPGNQVFHAAGAARHPCAFLGMTLADADIRARIRVGPGGTQQHNGLAARGNNMIEATMDGFVGQLMGDVNRRRIAEYTDGVSPPAELIGLDVGVTRMQWYSLRLRYVGDAIDFFVDGALTLAAIKPGSDGQMLGLYAHDTDIDYDDLTVRMAIAPEPVATLGPREACD